VEDEKAGKTVTPGSRGVEYAVDLAGVKFSFLSGLKHR
jgi:hypothetical protein